ncbi:MAG: PAS domain S-box protein [Actinomycetota bacterium]
MTNLENFLLPEQINLLDQILATSTDHIYVFDRAGRFLYASPTGLTTLGLEAGEILGKTGRELNFPAEVVERHDAQRESVFETGIPVKGETHFPTTQGLRDYEYSISPIFGTDGAIHAVLSSVREITERKQAEETLRRLTEELEARVQARTQELVALDESLQLKIAEHQKAEQALQESERHFSMLRDAMFEGMLIHENRMILDANLGLARIFGYSLEELIGQPIDNFLTPESLEMVRRQIESQYELPYEITGINKDGTLINLEVVGRQNLYQGRNVRVVALRDITARKLAEQALQKSEATLKKAQEIAHVGNWEANLASGQVYWSEEIYHIHGLDPTQPIVRGEIVHPYLHPDDQAKYQQEILEKVAVGECFATDLRILRPDRSLRFIEARGEPCFDAHNNLISYRGTVQDITDRKQLELSLQASEAKLSKILNNVGASIASIQLFTDRTWKYDYYSVGCEAVFGYTAAEMMTGIWWSRVSPDERESVVQRLQAAIFAGNSVQIEYRFQHKNGTLRWISSALSSHWDDHKDCWQVIAIDTDMTDRKQSELALRGSEARFAAVFQSSPDAILITRFSDGQILDVNTQFLLISGYTRSEAIGQTTVALQWWASATERSTLIACLQTERFIQNHESTFRRKSGKTFVGIFSCQVIELGGQTCAVSVIRDISSRKRMELELKAANARYNRVMQSIGEAIWECDFHTNLSKASKRYWEMLGDSSRDEDSIVPTQNFLSRIHPEDASRFATAFQLHCDQHERYDLEMRLRHQQGHYIWVRSRGQAIWDDQDRPLRMIGTIEEIGDRKQLELELQESQAKLSEVLESTIAGIVKLRFYPDGVFEYDYVSPYCETIYGYTADELMADAHLWRSRLHPEDLQERLFPLMQTILNQVGTATYTMEYRFRRKDELIVWVLANLWVQWDATGGYWKITTVDTNISELKQAEEALRASEERLRITLEATQTGTWDWNMVTNEIIWSESLERLMGLQPGTFDGRFETFAMMLDADDRQRVLECITRSVEQGDRYEIEFRFVKRDGSIRWALSKGHILRDRSGRAIRMVGVDVDITDRKQVEIALQASETRYRSLTEISPVGIFRFDRLFNCVYVNDRWSEMTGRSKASALGRGWLEALHPDEVESLLTQWAQQYAQPHSGNFILTPSEGRHIRPDGSINWYYVQVAEEIDGTGAVIGYVGTLTDITARKQAEIALQASETRFLELSEYSPVNFYTLVMRVDGSFYFEHISRAIEAIHETPVEQFLENAHLIVDCIHPEDLASYQAKVQHSLETLEPFSHEWRMITPSGKLKWLQGNSCPKPRDNGEIAWYGAVIETTERKQTEEALQRSESRFQRLAAAAPGVIYSWSFTQEKGGHYEYLNPYFEITHELPIAEVLEDYNLTVEQIHPDDRENYLQVVAHSVETQQPFQHEWRIITRSGKVKWLYSSAQPELRENGEVVWHGVGLDLSGRKQAEQTLAKELLRIQTLFNTCFDGIVVLDRDNRVLDANLRFAEMLGYSPEEVAQLQTSDWDAKFTKEELQQFTQNCLIHRKGVFETQHRRKDGSIFDVEISYNVVEWEGEILRFCDCRDISDRKRMEAEREQAEARLQEREALLRLFAQYAPAGIAMFDRQMRYLMISQRWLDDYHPGPLTSFIGRSHYEAIPGIPDSYKQVHQRCLAGAIEKGEGWFIGLEGTQIWTRWEVRPWYKATGEIGGIIIFSEDITQRKQAELALQELNQSLEQMVTERTAELQVSEAQIRQQANRETLLREITQRIRQSLDLQTIFETACQEILQGSQAERVAIFRFDPESQFDDGAFVAEALIPEFPSVLATPVHDHCFGNDYAPLYQQGRVQATSDINNAGLQDCHRQVLAQFQIRANLIVPLLQGNDLWGLLCIHQCSAPRQWQSFEIQVAQEIANQLALAIQQASLFEQLQQQLRERQQAQQQLAERNQQLALFNQELARATRLKDEFLANMSHEFRTPLNAILGMTEGLQEQIFGEVNEQQQKALQTVKRTGSHLLELINDLLDLAKVESGQIELSCTPAPVAVLCQSSLEFIKQQALKKQIELELKLPSYLPEICVDERRIRQVLVNLLNNAVKFTPNGGRITLEVSLPNFEREGEEEEDWLRFAVRDTGIGIAPENIHKLFQPFVQIDSALNRQYEGTGLGLSLVKRLVELHGGQVGLTSELGVGSCFTIELPGVIVQPPAPEAQPQIDPRLEPSSPDRATSPLILLVEDNEDNIVTVASYLEVKGNRLLVARNGQEAIALTQSECPDLILMDIQMPGMDGLEAIRQIRRLPQMGQIPIIALTALAMTGDRERCLAAGANDYLSKPVKLKQLAATIQQFLASDRVK